MELLYKRIEEVQNTHIINQLNLIAYQTYTKLSKI